MKKKDQITILTSSSDHSEKVNLSTFKGFSKKEIKIITETWANNLKNFMEKIKPVIESQTVAIGQFSVTEIDLNLAVNASGGIDLIGKLDLGVEGGITIRLSRNK